MNTTHRRNNIVESSLTLLD